MTKMTKHVLSFALLLTIFGLPLLAGAQFNPTEGSGSTQLSTDSLSDTVINIIKVLLTMITLLAVLGFIIAGIYFLTAGSNGDRVETAKSWLTYSIIGVVVSLIGYVVVQFVDRLINI